MRDLYEMERDTIRMIEEVKARYQAEIDPLVRHLTNIRDLMPQPPIIIDMKDLPTHIVERIKWEHDNV